MMQNRKRRPFQPTNARSQNEKKVDAIIDYQPLSNIKSKYFLPTKYYRSTSKPGTI
jgi:hypothetical protein